MSKILGRSAVAGILAAAFALAAHGAPSFDEGNGIVRGEQHGIDYRSGGIGKEGRQAMRRGEGRYDLHVVLSAGRHNAYVGDARVDVKDARGRDVLHLRDAGPLVDAKLPPGDYTVSARYGAAERLQKVHVGAGKPAAAYLHFGEHAVS
jgi:hypothetical protein